MSTDFFVRMKEKNEKKIIKYVKCESRWSDPLKEYSLVFQDDKGLLEDLDNDAIEKIFFKALKKWVKVSDKSYKTKVSYGLFGKKEKRITRYTFEF